MRILLCLIILSLGLSACGYKGSLKTPDQIRIQEEKAKRQAEKEAQKRAKEETKEDTESAE